MHLWYARPIMGWFVAKAGKTVGPFPEAEIADAIASGLLVRGQQIREEGATSWIPVEQHPTLGSVVLGKAASQRPARHVISWPTIAALAGLLTLCAACALICLQLRTHDAMLARIDNVTKHVDGVLLELRDASAAPQWLPESQVHNNCLSDRTTVTCTFTNLSEKAVTTCTKGKLVQKGAPGVKLESLTFCTGKLAPSESRVVSGPWVGGFADDICFKENNYGKQLDWSKCSFSTEAVDLPTIRKVAAVAAAK
jgi:hypothetical protein